MDSNYSQPSKLGFFRQKVGIAKCNRIGDAVWWNFVFHPDQDPSFNVLRRKLYDHYHPLGIANADQNISDTTCKRSVNDGHDNLSSVL